MEYCKVEKTLGNLVSDNVKKLESLFPCVVKDGEVDFEELRELLGDFEEVDKEKYEMNWVGKKEAKRIALTPLDGKTLKYIKGNGKNEDTTENLYIEGDNLEALKLLQNSYYGKVKMIYIDPPYNTGNDFIYDDNFKEEKLNIEILEGEKNEYGERLIKNQKSSSHYHSKWLSMMYSRLLVCKNILTDDGVIFISIDDNEVSNLKKICDEVFGEYNFINKVVWQRNSSGKTVSKQLPVNIEYILIYAKSNDYLLNPIYKPLSEATIKSYSKDDNDGRGKYCTVSFQKTSNPGPETTYDYVDNNGKVWSCPAKGWRMKKEKIKQLENDGRVYFDGDTLREKCYWNERKNKGKLADTLWNDLSENSAASRELAKLFDGKYIFDSPKPIDLIQRCISLMPKDSIIVDFFAGSSSTAHAVLDLNVKESANRKFILIQIPENIDLNSEAYKEDYKNICEIGKDRIRRAGDKIVKENKDNPKINTLDIGFKVFKVENSNIKWENRINEDNQFKYNLDGGNIDDIDFMPNTKDIDVVYEILLRHYGIPLTAKINKLDFIGDRTYTIEDSIIVCLETKITQDIIDKISELEPIKVIFRDSAFGDDISLKQNSIHRLNVLIEENNKNTTHVVEFI